MLALLEDVSRTKAGKYTVCDHELVLDSFKVFLLKLKSRLICISYLANYTGATI